MYACVSQLDEVDDQSTLPENIEEAEETVDPSTFRESLHTDGGDTLSFELPTEGTEVILEELQSMETCSRENEGTKLKRRAACLFKAAWPGATFEAGVGWAVVAPHTSLTEEEAAYAESGYLSSLRVSELEEFDFSMPVEQRSAWTVLVPDGVSAPRFARLFSNTNPSEVSIAT